VEGERLEGKKAGMRGSLKVGREKAGRLGGRRFARSRFEVGGGACGGLRQKVKGARRKEEGRGTPPVKSFFEGLLRSI
jgi:hypothetical protein